MAELQKNVERVLETLDGLQITNDEENREAAEFLKDIKTTEKIVTEHFEPARKEAKAAYDKVLSDKKFYIDKLKRAEQATKKMMSEWRAAEEERRRKEQEDKLLEEAESTGNEEALNQEVDAKPKEKLDGISYQTYWTYEIVDASKLPMAMLVPDEKRIGQLVRTHKEEAQQILGPGVKVKKEQRVVARSEA